MYSAKLNALAHIQAFSAEPILKKIQTNSSIILFIWGFENMAGLVAYASSDEDDDIQETVSEKVPWLTHSPPLIGAAVFTKSSDVDRIPRENHTTLQSAWFR